LKVKNRLNLEGYVLFTPSDFKRYSKEELLEEHQVAIAKEPYVRPSDEELEADLDRF